MNDDTRAQLRLACAFGLVYLALMSGHMYSMDGLFMFRQAQALVFDGSLRFQHPVWTWRSDPSWNSMYGIGLSLLYVPGMLATAGMRARIPIAVDRPPDVFEFYLKELYEDPLYTIGGAWVHVAVVALSSFLVARLTRAVGGSPRAALWAMLFYGVGSSALVYSGGDFAQALEGLCWVAACLGAVRFRDSCSTRALIVCSVACGYAILTRPLEGVLLQPAVIAMLLPAGRVRSWQLRSLKPAVAVAVAVTGAVAITLLVNAARFGDPLMFGYESDNGWVFPDARRWAGVLFSPRAGLFWEFPAMLLVPLGALAVFRAERGRAVVLAMLGLSLALLANTAAWYMWWGGWCWGLRLFSPALPLLATLAGVGTMRLRPRLQRWAPFVLLLAGFCWAVPGTVTDLLGGFGGVGDGAVWNVQAYPPFGAWSFLERLFPNMPTDGRTLDVVWFRHAGEVGAWLTAVPVVLIVMSGVLAASAITALWGDDRRS